MGCGLSKTRASLEEPVASAPALKLPDAEVQKILRPGRRISAKNEPEARRIPLRTPADRLAKAASSEIASIPEEEVVEGEHATPADQQYESAKRYFLAEKFEEAKEEFAYVEKQLGEGQTKENFRNLIWYIGECNHRLEREERLSQAENQRRKKSNAVESEAVQQFDAKVHAMVPGARNSPGTWMCFISYTQRNDKARLLASELYQALKERGHAVWLDVKMGDKSEAAMQEGVENSKAVLAIISDGAGVKGNAYFERDYCLKELRWAKANGTYIQPLVLEGDKPRISELLKGNPETGLVGATEDLLSLGSTDFVDVIQSDLRHMKTCIDIILENCRKAGVPGISVQTAHGAS